MDELRDASSPSVGKKDNSAALLRKSNKPLMEKRRRERINNCLDQLKSILMEVTKKESSYYSKLEKADILEMTVKYLKTLKRQHGAATSTTTGCGESTEALCKYVAGFNECAKEVTQYLTSVGDVSTDARTCLLSHLANSLQHRGPSQPPACLGSSPPSASTSPAADLVDLLSSLTSAQSSFDVPAASSSTASATAQFSATTAVYVVNPTGSSFSSASSPPAIGQMQLVQARLPNGEVVFLLTPPPASTAAVTSPPQATTTIAAASGSDDQLPDADSTLQSPPPPPPTQEQQVKQEVNTKFSFDRSSTPTTFQSITPSGLCATTDGLVIDASRGLWTTSTTTTTTSDQPRPIRIAPDNRIGVPIPDVVGEPSTYSERTPECLPLPIPSCAYAAASDAGAPSQKQMDSCRRNLLQSAAASSSVVARLEDGGLSKLRDEDREENNNDVEMDADLLPMWRPW